MVEHVANSNIQEVEVIMDCVRVLHQPEIHGKNPNQAVRTLKATPKQGVGQIWLMGYDVPALNCGASNILELN